MQLRKAERKQAKLRIGLSSPSGAGKTFSSLELAHGICSDWSKIALIDTENGSGELYSHLGNYNVLPLEPPFTPERFIEAIEICEKGGMEVIIIDSISHEWEGNGGCLSINDNIAQAKFKGNTWAAWSETTPRHQKFIEKITLSDCHIITTVRNKIDTAIVDGRPKKVGIKEQTREGFEYELTVNFNIDRDKHLAVASKDRTGLFIDMDPFLISEETGKQIIEWNKSGKKVKTKEEQFLEFKEKVEKTEKIEDINIITEELKKEIGLNSRFITKEQMGEISILIKDKKKIFEEMDYIQAEGEGATESELQAIDEEQK